MEIIIWIFIAYGITSIINWGSIFDSPRDWLKRNIPILGEMLTCTLCTATWVGFIMSIILGSITQNYIESHYLVNIFLDGMFTAGSIWALNAIIEYFEENRPENE